MLKMKIKDTHLHILTKFGNISKEVEKELQDELDSLGLDIISNLKTKMRNTPKQNKTTGTKGHRPSVAGAMPAIENGDLIKSLEMARIGTFLEVGTSIEYAKYLQKGTKGWIKARPFIEQSIDGIDIDGRLKSAIMRGFGI